jgi:hypothetical protein
MIFEYEYDDEDDINKTEPSNPKHDICYLFAVTWHPVSGIRHPASGNCLLKPET